MHVHVWQSGVEIKFYSIAYFDDVTAFKSTVSLNSGTHTHCVNTSISDTSMLYVPAPSLREFKVQRNSARMQ